MKEKRENSVLLPYKKNGAQIFFYLQKRAADAKRAPGVFGMFGGGMEEGETPETAMFREIEEELVYKPQRPIYFSRYEAMKVITHAFMEEVDDAFENGVTVQEGEYGKFLSIEEIQAMPDISPVARLITFQIAETVMN